MEHALWSRQWGTQKGKAYDALKCSVCPHKSEVVAFSFFLTLDTGRPYVLLDLYTEMRVDDTCK